MTRKHYQAMATIFKVNLAKVEIGSEAYQVLSDTIRDFAQLASEDSPRFNIGRFYTACNLQY